MAGDVMRLGLVLSATDKMSRVVGSAVDKSIGRLTAFANKVNKISGVWTALGAGALGAGMLKTVNAAGEQLKANKRLEQVFKSMWGDTGAVKNAAIVQEKFADDISLQIGVDRAIIKQTQAKIATFQHLSNKTAIMTGVFKRATMAAIDMAAVGFGEATQNAVTLGKALEDPVNMATALKRMGTLTTKDIIDIKDVMRLKGLAAAQETMLKAVERQVGGTAAATATASDILRISVNNINEAIGKSFTPTLKQGKVATSSFILKLTDWIEAHQKLIRILTYTTFSIIGLTFAFKGAIMVASFFQKSIIITKAILYGLRMAYLWTSGTIWYYSSVLKASTIWTKAAAAGQWLLNAAMSANPVMLIVLGIAALIAVVVICWKKFATFRAVILTTWETIKGFGGILKDYVLDRIKGIISGLGSMGKAIGLLFHGKFKAAFDEAKKGVKALSGYDAKMKAIGKTKQLVTGISAKYTTILAKEREADKPKSKVSTISTSNSISNYKPVSSSSHASTINYSPTVHVNGGSAKDKADFSEMLKNHKRELEQAIQNIQNKNKRVSFA